mmetsp:Transcript_9755/g.23243  ORF Transcript_9755/g.23243 Transcript_9755/m.23243 type:complete len:237 (-) Transcript_9755:210-920(-)
MAPSTARYPAPSAVCTVLQTAERQLESTPGPHRQLATPPRLGTQDRSWAAHPASLDPGKATPLGGPLASSWPAWWAQTSATRRRWASQPWGLAGLVGAPRRATRQCRRTCEEISQAWIADDLAAVPSKAPHTHHRCPTRPPAPTNVPPGSAEAACPANHHRLPQVRPVQSPGSTVPTLTQPMTGQTALRSTLQKAAVHRPCRAQDSPCCPRPQDLAGAGRAGKALNAPCPEPSCTA